MRQDLPPNPLEKARDSLSASRYAIEMASKAAQTSDPSQQRQREAPQRLCKDFALQETRLRWHLPALQLLLTWQVYRCRRMSLLPLRARQATTAREEVAGAGEAADRQRQGSRA